MAGGAPLWRPFPVVVDVSVLDLTLSEMTVRYLFTFFSSEVHVPLLQNNHRFLTEDRRQKYIYSQAAKPISMKLYAIVQSPVPKGVLGVTPKCICILVVTFAPST